MALEADRFHAATTKGSHLFFLDNLSLPQNGVGDVDFVNDVDSGASSGFHTDNLIAMSAADCIVFFHLANIARDGDLSLWS